MFCCFVALDDVHEKSTSHHLEKSASFCCPSSRVLAAFHFQPTPPWQPGHQQLLGEVWRFQALGRQIKYFQRVWNLNPPTKQIVCFHRPHNKMERRPLGGHSCGKRWDTKLAPPNPRTLHPSNGLGTLRNGVRWQHDVTGLQGLRINIWTVFPDSESPMEVENARLWKLNSSSRARKIPLNHDCGRVWVDDG